MGTGAREVTHEVRRESEARGVETKESSPLLDSLSFRVHLSQLAECSLVLSPLEMESLLAG